MDLFDKLNAGLEPLGGPLFVDAFVAARRSVHVRPHAVPPGTPRTASPGQPAGRAPLPDAPPEPDAASEAAPVLQDEVEAYLSRDQIEGADDAEVQEFLKERSGYDPSSLE